MSNYYTEGTVFPTIPSALVSDRDLDLISKFLDHEVIVENNNSEHLYFFSYDFHSICFDEEENEIADDDLFKIFQTIISGSKGKIPYIYMMFAGTCDRMRPESHGGSAVFITAKTVKQFSTWSWVDECIREIDSPAGPFDIDDLSKKRTWQLRRAKHILDKLNQEGFINLIKTEKKIILDEELTRRELDEKLEATAQKDTAIMELTSS